MAPNAVGGAGARNAALTRIFVKTVLGFYRERGGGPSRGQSGAMVAVYPFGYHKARQRTSSDLKLDPHIYAVFLDGAYRDKGDELDFRAVGHLSTRDVAAVLESTRDRMVKYLRRHGLLQDGDSEDEGDGLAVLAASAVLGTTPPSGASLRAAPRRAALRKTSDGVRAPAVRRSRRLHASRRDARRRARRGGQGGAAEVRLLGERGPRSRRSPPSGITKRVG